MRFFFFLLLSFRKAMILIMCKVEIPGPLHHPDITMTSGIPPKYPKWQVVCMINVTLS